MTIARSPAPSVPAGPRSVSCRGSLQLHDCTGGRGFTLVEILTVMAILSLLTAITLPAIRGLGERGTLARTRAELSLMAGALEVYRRAYGDYPQTGNFLTASSETTQALHSDHAQARFFNALRGIFGPNCTDRGSGPGGGDFIDFARIEAGDVGCGAQHFFRSHRHKPGAAGHIEEMVAGFQSVPLERPAAVGRAAPQESPVNDRVVVRGPRIKQPVHKRRLPLGAGIMRGQWGVGNHGTALGWKEGEGQTKRQRRREGCNALADPLKI